MPSFNYVAIAPGGRIVRGVAVGSTEMEVVEWLQRNGNVPMRAEPALGRSRWPTLINIEVGRRGLSRQDVANVTRELSIMLQAGQDIDRALRFLVETAGSRRARSAIECLRSDVRDGSPLSTAMMRQPANFSRLYVGLVGAGEAGGTLGATLDRLAMMLERQRSLSATVTSALIYPSVLVMASVGSIVLLLTDVLPQFVPLFEQNGASLPRPTQILIDIGAGVSAYGSYGLLGFLALAIAARQTLRQPSARLVVDRLLPRLPVIGALIREVLAARFCRTLGTLLVNGVPLISALDAARGTMTNLAGVAAIDRATVGAKEGAGVARPLGEAGIFPVRTIHMLQLGEETAQLGEMALRAAGIHEEITRIGVQRLVALIVPAITILMGAAIAGIISSLLLAMLSLNDLAN